MATTAKIRRKTRKKRKATNRPRAARAPAPNANDRRSAKTPSNQLRQALAEAATVAPPVDEIARALGWTIEGTMKVVRSYEYLGGIECWPDPARIDGLRIMLDAATATRMGLQLSAKGDRWIMRGANPAGPG